MSVLLVATFETKREEADYIAAALGALDVPVTQCDISLQADGAQWSPKDKIRGMERAAARAIAEIAQSHATAPRTVLALGGGTGGQIAVNVLRALPVEIPKILLTTLPFDPRYIMADSRIVLVPTIADLCGLNATTRSAMDQAAAIAAGLYRAAIDSGPAFLAPSVGVTSLGVTSKGTDALCAGLRAAGEEATLFHANGFGGAAFARWARIGAFKSVIDYTPHELTRYHLGGVSVNMPDRFTAMGHLPRVLLPGGVNFIGMGEPHLMPEAYRARPHYAHSPLFTHVQCTEDEVIKCAHILGGALTHATAPTKVLLPMDGFSSEDKAGGAIESETLRHVFAETLEQHIPVARIDGHINDASTAQAAIAALEAITKDPAHV